jgi:hypothetical protein
MIDVADCQWALIGLAVAAFEALVIAAASIFTALCPEHC